MKLIFHLDDGKVQEFTTTKSSVSIGRGNNCDVVLPYEGFSRRHAQLDFVDGEIFVTDLESTNGVYIDGERIPSSKKTLMQRFLNLQIGPAQQIEILEDEEISSPAKQQGQKGSDGRASKTFDVSEKTKSTNVESRQSKKNTDKTKSNKNGTSKVSLLLVPVLVVVAAIYYYMGNTEEEAPIVATAEQVEAPVVPLQETQFLSTSMLASLDKNKSCAGALLAWCKDAGIVEESLEGVVIESRTLLVYMNMTPLTMIKYSGRVEELDAKKRFQILVLRRIFNSFLMRTISRQTQIDNVQVVAGQVENGQWNLKAAIKMKRDIDLIKYDKFFMYGLFDKILNEGEVEKLSEIANLYEDLPLE